MSIFLVILAGAIIALSNLAMRKSLDGGKSAKGFLVFQMLSGCLFSILLNPALSGNYSWNTSIVYFGLISGAILACMLFFLSKALESGPPGFTFSILSAATVMPAIVMALVWGDSHGFPYTIWHGLGSLFVLGGLFWAGKGLVGLQDWKRWAFFSCMMFLLHIALLSLFQWRAFLLKMSSSQTISSLFTFEEIQSQWFLPFMFLGAFVIQLAIYWKTEKRKFEFSEISYGLLGGAANGIAVFFLLWSTEIASSLQNAVIFPIYSVATIILSNLWGQKLYAEQVNWKACQFCAFGLVIGTVDWNGIVAAFGF